MDEGGSLETLECVGSVELLGRFLLVCAVRDIWMAVLLVRSKGREE